MVCVFLNVSLVVCLGTFDSKQAAMAERGKGGATGGANAGAICGHAHEGGPHNHAAEAEHRVQPRAAGCRKRAGSRCPARARCRDRTLLPHT